MNITPEMMQQYQKYERLRTDGAQGYICGKKANDDTGAVRVATKRDTP